MCVTLSQKLKIQQQKLSPKTEMAININEK